MTTAEQKIDLVLPAPYIRNHAVTDCRVCLNCMHLITPFVTSISADRRIRSIPASIKCDPAFGGCGTLTFSMQMRDFLKMDDTTIVHHISKIDAYAKMSFHERRTSWLKYITPIDIVSIVLGEGGTKGKWIWGISFTDDVSLLTHGRLVTKCIIDKEELFATYSEKQASEINQHRMPVSERDDEFAELRDRLGRLERMIQPLCNVIEKLDCILRRSEISLELVVVNTENALADAEKIKTESNNESFV